MRTVGLDVLGIDPVVAYVRIGKGDDLPAVGGIGEDFLITSQCRIENDFARSVTGSTKGPTLE